MVKNKKTYRDCLALERTELSIDRTLLAYLRTSLTLIIVGITFVKFFEQSFIVSVGWIFMLVSLGLMLFGVTRCNKFKKVRTSSHTLRFGS